MPVRAGESFDAPVGMKETHSSTVSRGTKPSHLNTVLATASVIGSADHQLSHAETQEQKLETKKVNEVDTEIKVEVVDITKTRRKQSKAH